MEGLTIMFKAVNWMLMIMISITMLLCFINTLRAARYFIEIPNFMDLLEAVLSATTATICVIAFAALVMYYRMTF
jgi:hypothetical protein